MCTGIDLLYSTEWAIQIDCNKKLYLPSVNLVLFSTTHIFLVPAQRCNATFELITDVKLLRIQQKNKVRIISKP